MTDEPNTAEVTRDLRRKGIQAMLETLLAYADANQRAEIVIYPNGGWAIDNYERMEQEADERAEKRHRLASRPDDRPTSAIEAAFRAGHAAAEEALGAHGSDHLLDAIERAWSDYRADNALENVA